ncbi:MAG: hypothetical protein ABIJ61_08715, partial [bacterium]
MQSSKLLRRIFKKAPQVEEFLAHLQGRETIQLAGLAGCGAAMLAAEILENCRTPLLLILPTERLVDRMVADLREIVEPQQVAGFPDWGMHPYSWLAPATENVAQRLETIYRLKSNGPAIIVATPDALLTPTIAPTDLE